VKAFALDNQRSHELKLQPLHVVPLLNACIIACHPIALLIVPDRALVDRTLLFLDPLLHCSRCEPGPEFLSDSLDQSTAAA
jgi:hypothetical protein